MVISRFEFPKKHTHKFIKLVVDVINTIMKTVAFLLAFLATAKAQCASANFGLKVSYSVNVENSSTKSSHISCLLHF